MTNELFVIPIHLSDPRFDGVRKANHIYVSKSIIRSDMVTTPTKLTIVLLLSLTACKERKNGVEGTQVPTIVNKKITSGYSKVNGLNMYYEIHGKGQPLVLIHGGGSTIETSFGRLIPFLAQHRQVIAVEMQAHGRTSDRDADLSFEQDADDVATLLKNLKIEKADLLGFSNGATTAMQVAIRHPTMVNKMVLGSALAKRNGVPDWFWDFMLNASLDNMPAQLKEGYLKVASDPKGLQVMHDRDAKRMVHFKDISEALIRSIKVPTLIINGDKDVILPEHALELHRMIEGSELAIIPGGHGAYIGEITTLASDHSANGMAVSVIEVFLNKKL